MTWHTNLDLGKEQFVARVLIRTMRLQYLSHFPIDADSLVGILDTVTAAGFNRSSVRSSISSTTSFANPHVPAKLSFGSNSIAGGEMLVSCCCLFNKMSFLRGRSSFFIRLCRTVGSPNSSVSFLRNPLPMSNRLLLLDMLFRSLLNYYSFFRRNSFIPFISGHEQLCTQVPVIGSRDAKRIDKSGDDLLNSFAHVPRG